MTQITSEERVVCLRSKIGVQIHPIHDTSSCGIYTCSCYGQRRITSISEYIMCEVLSERFVFFFSPDDHHSSGIRDESNVGHFPSKEFHVSRRCVPDGPLSRVVCSL